VEVASWRFPTVVLATAYWAAQKRGQQERRKRQSQEVPKNPEQKPSRLNSLQETGALCAQVRSREKKDINPGDGTQEHTGEDSRAEDVPENAV